MFKIWGDFVLIGDGGPLHERDRNERARPGNGETPAGRVPERGQLPRATAPTEEDEHPGCMREPSGDAGADPGGDRTSSFGPQGPAPQGPPPFVLILYKHLNLRINCIYRNISTFFSPKAEQKHLDKKGKGCYNRNCPGTE